jgi:hypothetical protein
MATSATSAQIHVGPALSNVIPEPIATRSAAMFNVLAPIRITKSDPTTRRPRRWKCRVASSPSPVPVASAVRSHISWTPAISGNVTSAAQRNDRPYCDPAWA